MSPSFALLRAFGCKSSAFRALPRDKAPDYRVFAGQIEIGAGWKKTSGTGREYLSVKLDDPSLPAPIYASLVEAEGEGEFTLIWSRQQAE